MKRAIAAAILIMTGAAHAADNVITNYFDYKFIPASYTNAGDTGLSTGTAYCVFSVNGLTDLTTNTAAEADGDVRALVYGLLQTFWAAREASTNQTQTTIGRGAAYESSGTNVTETIIHSVKSTRTIGTATFP